jgi:hypothetical protein
MAVSRLMSSLFLVVFITMCFASTAFVGAKTTDTCSADDGTCTSSDTETCEDNHEMCSFWAEEDECDENPNCE